MVQRLTLADSLSLGDLHTYLQRAGRVEDGSVRLIAGSGILAVYTAILYPRGILDESPTVLGLRTFELLDTEDFDAVVPMRSLVERIVRARAEVGDDDESRPVTHDAAARGEHRDVGGHLTAAGRLAAARRDGCRDARVRRPRRHRRGRRGDPRGHGRAARAARALRGVGARRPRARVRADGRGVRGVQPRLPRRRPGAPLRDGPVDAPHRRVAATCSCAASRGPSRRSRVEPRRERARRARQRAGDRRAPPRGR